MPRPTQDNSPRFEAFFVRKLKDFEVLDDVRMGITGAALHVFPNLSIREEFAAGVVERTRNHKKVIISAGSLSAFQRVLHGHGVREFVVEFVYELLDPQFRRVARLSVKKDVSGSSNRISITLATTCLGQAAVTETPKPGDEAPKLHDDNVFLQDKKNCRRFFGSRIRLSDHDAFHSVAPWPNIRYHKHQHPTSDQVDSAHTRLRSFGGLYGFV